MTATPSAPPPTEATATEHVGSNLGKGPAATALRKALRSKAGLTEPASPGPAATPPKEGGQPGPAPAAPASSAEPAEPEPSSLPADAPADIRDKKSGKVNPWKLSNYWKEKHRELEGQLAESRRNALPEAEVKALRESADKASKRVEELESEIKFHDYTKSKEFQEKYQKPYEQAWQRAMAELREITVTGTDGETRPVSPEDLLELVNMPLGQAREVANELFGDFADDVMQHRKEIKRLSDEQANAIDTARKSAGERNKQQQEQAQALNKEVGETWSRVNSEIRDDPKFGGYFKERQGDAEWNKRLAKGFELADRAFAENPMSPGLKPEERAAIVRRHAAVRNRCASWGALRGENESLKTRVGQLEEELKQFKDSVPGEGSPRGAEAPAQGGSAWDQVRGALRSKAKPG